MVFHTQLSTKQDNKWNIPVKSCFSG